MSRLKGRAADSGRAAVARVLQELTLQLQTKRLDPLMEQLNSCPEAFEVGKLLEQSFRDAIDALNEERLLPPAGAVMSPYV